MSRCRSALQYVKVFLKQFDFRIEYINLIYIFTVLIYILHVTGCLWYAAHYGDINTYTNWVTANGY